MSVLIKGMEMPQSCFECRLFNDPWCMAKNGSQWRTAYNRPPKGEKQNDCPLIGVPPHGRLIDANALLNAIKKAGEDDPVIADIYEEDYAVVSGWIYTAPTVIPADKGGEI